MSTEAFEIAQAVLLSLGGGSIIVFFLSSFLGKVWAQRILQNEKVEHDQELSKFKNDLKALAQRNSLNFEQKLDLYKVVSVPLIELVALISKKGLTQDHVNEFDRKRLYISAQLVLFAPENVFDTFNDMVDYLYDSLEKKKDYSFHVFRNKALILLSEMRKDIGIYEDSISYKGHR